MAPIKAAVLQNKNVCIINGFNASLTHRRTPMQLVAPLEHIPPTCFFGPF